MKKGLRKVNNGRLLLQNTELGWLAMGGVLDAAIMPETEAPVATTQHVDWQSIPPTTEEEDKKDCAINFYSVEQGSVDEEVPLGPGEHPNDEIEVTPQGDKKEEYKIAKSTDTEGPEIATEEEDWEEEAVIQQFIVNAIKQEKIDVAEEDSEGFKQMIKSEFLMTLTQ